MDDVVGSNIEIDFFAHRYDDFIGSDNVVYAVFVDVVTKLPPPLLTLYLYCPSVAFSAEIEYRRDCYDRQEYEQKNGDHCPCELSFAVSVDLFWKFIGVVIGFFSEFYDDNNNGNSNKNSDCCRNKAIAASKGKRFCTIHNLSLIHISEPTRRS